MCLTVVLLVQGLLFADGGLSALGTNITLMGVVGVWTGYAVFRLALAVLPRRIGSVPLAAGIGGFASVPMAALTFAGLFTLGGTAPLDPGSLVAAMASVHTLIGVGEGVLTALVVGSVVAVRPDLVHGARRIRAASIQAAAPAPSSGQRA